jgi:hypothetical protein
VYISYQKQDSDKAAKSFFSHLPDAQILTHKSDAQIFNRCASIFAKKNHFHSAPAVERNWQLNIQAESAGCVGQSFKPAEEK